MNSRKQKVSVLDFSILIMVSVVYNNSWFPAITGQVRYLYWLVSSIVIHFIQLQAVKNFSLELQNSQLILIGQFTLKN